MAPTLSSGSCAKAETATQSAQAPGSSLLPYDAWLYLRDSLRLSTRELRIVQGVFDDEEPDTIADALAVSPDIVYRAMQRIYVKLHIGSRAELVVRVMSEYLAFEGDQAQTGNPELLSWPVKA